MALRMTRRDTYGGTRGWQDGAGVSWTDPDGGGRDQWREREPVDLDETAEGQRELGPRTGIWNNIATKLGLRKGPKNYQRSDERIREDICERLMEAWMDAEHVEVQVKDGEVTLLGSVRTRDEKHAIENLSAAVLGVKDVHNHLRLERGGAREESDMRRPVEPPSDTLHS